MLQLLPHSSSATALHHKANQFEDRSQSIRQQPNCQTALPCILFPIEDIYPQTKQFKPERFLVRQFSRYEYYSFGGGNRRCIGMAFAQMEIELVLATILSHWRLSLVDDRPVRPVERSVTLTPPPSLEMVANCPN